MIGTFTTNGVDLDIVRKVLKVTKEVPIERAYDSDIEGDYRPIHLPASIAQVRNR
jgi:hypothetical protein